MLGISNMSNKSCIIKRQLISFLVTLKVRLF
nr:MAG TPA: hypothetical protein [Caudoviricetes sp.]